MKIKKNGKVINLTESDLRRIVKRVLTEQSEEDISKGKKTGCYTVKKGDQLLKIANSFGITLDDIKALNGKTNGNIYPGEKLRVQNRTEFKGCQ